MADTMMELDMEFSRNAGEIITSNAEEWVLSFTCYLMHTYQ
jgi:hypothetical protein